MMPEQRANSSGEGGQPEPAHVEVTASHSRRGDGLQELNSFAVVTYIPDPLGAFLDELRRELQPNCIPHAHMTILPSRPLELPVEQAWSLICERAARFPVFEVEPAEIEVFENTLVAYIGVRKGRQELVRLHDALSEGPLWFAEPYPYHPHITVAQEFAPEQMWEIAERARRRWAECPYPRSFLVDSLTIVRATADNRWLDLASCRLGAACAR